MNSPFMVRQANVLANFLTTQTDGADPRYPPEASARRFIQKAYLVLYGRPAGDAELRLGLEFLKGSKDTKSRRQQYAQVLLAANEMLFID
jgi:hypothetical protein